MSSGVSVGLAAYKLSTQISPIILNNGIASAIPGKMLPIIAITEALNFPVGILSGGENIGLDNFFADFMVIPGGTLIDQMIGKYPFANQGVAANAVIAQPLRVSLLMVCPVRGEAGYAVKLATMMALQNALKVHNASGGTYTIITPAAFYDNCVMTSLSDASTSESKQLQNAWRWDFEQPLLTQASVNAVEQSLNGLMSQISSGGKTDGNAFGLAQASTPATLAASAIIPSATGGASSLTAVASSLIHI